MLILCSRSPRRRDFLDLYGCRFEIRPADVDETPLRGESPAAFLERICESKVLAGSRGAPAPTEATPPSGSPGRPTLFLAADTILEFEGKILGKPADREEAVEILSRLTGQTHRVVTGCCLLWRTWGELPSPLRNSLRFMKARPLPVREPGEIHYYIEETSRVVFKPAGLYVIQDYVNRFDPLDKAGAYGIQDPCPLVDHYEGSLANIVGLPLGRLAPILAWY